MRAGVTGVSVMRTPNDASASSIALAMAAGGEMAPPSPSPLAPSGLRGDGNSRWTVSIGGGAAGLGGAGAPSGPPRGGPSPPEGHFPQSAAPAPRGPPPGARPA